MSTAAPQTPQTVQATARYVRTSARKARLVCDLVRGKSVSDAQAILAYSTRAAAVPVRKVLQSAIANADHNHGLDVARAGPGARDGQRGADDQALPSPGHGPRDEHPQAHLPHHHRPRRDGAIENTWVRRSTRSASASAC